MHTEDLIDPNDGENRAVRSFLLLYSGTPGLTFGTMKKHLKMSGYPYWPDWVNGLEGEHLNKLGAQNWLRYLFSLESTAKDYIEILKTELAVERSSRRMFVCRIENEGTTPMTGESVLALLNDCDMLANREFDIPSRLEVTFGNDQEGI